MLKPCFIIPPSPFLLDERVFPSLGILKVAAALRAGGGPQDLRVLDLSGVEDVTGALDSFLDPAREQAVCLTATSPQMPAARKIIEYVRACYPGMRIILGGPHPTLVNAAVKYEDAQGRPDRACRAMFTLTGLCDVVVAGDGESAIFEALGDDPAQVIDADDRTSPFFQSREAYAQSPFPARDLIDLSSYHYAIDGKNATSLISQLGCPFQCGFCGGRNSSMLRAIRTRPVDKVIEEIEHLYRTYGYTGFMFYDDELNVNRKTFEAMMGLLVQLQFVISMGQLAEHRVVFEPGFRLRGFIKAELFHRWQAAAMFVAGFRWILCGFESADERILVNINKRATLEDNANVVRWAHQSGLKIKALMSIGHPGETKQSVEKIGDWLIEQKVDDFDITIITPYPGSPYYDEAVPVREPNHGINMLIPGATMVVKGQYVYTQPKTGDRLYMRDVDFSTEAGYYKGVPGEYVSFVHTDHLSADDLVRLRDEVDTRVRRELDMPFYSRPEQSQHDHSMGQGGMVKP